MWEVESLSSFGHYSRDVTATRIGDKVFWSYNREAKTGMGSKPNYTRVPLTTSYRTLQKVSYECHWHNKLFLLHENICVFPDEQCE